MIYILLEMLFVRPDDGCFWPKHVALCILTSFNVVLDCLNVNKQ
jgi:hypothetical protein